MKIKGKISRFISKSADGNHDIALFIDFVSAKKTIMISGPITLMKVNVVYELEGELVLNKYNNKKIFNVSKFIDINKKEDIDIVSFFSSSIFPTIGKQDAQKIDDYFKTNDLNKIYNRIDELANIETLSEAKRVIIKNSLHEYLSEDWLLKEFINNDLKIDFLNHCRNNIKNDIELENIIKNDFYSYANQNKLKPFKEVDKIALHFGIEQLSSIRITWFARNIIDNGKTKSDGDTYIKPTRLFDELQGFFPMLSIGQLQNKLLEGIDQRALYIQKGESTKIYSYTRWEEEEEISDIISGIYKASQYKEDIPNFDKVLKEVEEYVAKQLGIEQFKYDEEQVNVLKNFLKNDFSIVTGGPGTGKTTLIMGMAKIFEIIYKSKDIAILAPTGRAAGRINEKDNNLNTSTIHRFLKYKGNGEFIFNKKNQYSTDLIIIDESSMLEQNLFAELLRATIDYKKLVLVGDVNQLPSIGYGNIFQDLIGYKEFCINVLKNNHRQNSFKENGIIELSNAIISEDNLEDFDFEAYDDVEFIEVNPTTKIDSICSEYSKYIKNDFKKDTLNLQLISPMYEKQIGIINLNIAIQRMLRDQKKENYQRNRYSFFENDKIIYLENNPNLEIYNGDVGYIQKLNKEVNYFKYADCVLGEKNVRLSNSHFNEVELAYAISIHKTQGSEYENVFLVLDPTNTANNFFVTKNMLYTAVSRAKEKLIIFGQKKEFIKYCKKLPRQRLTTLKEKIKLKCENLLLN